MEQFNAVFQPNKRPVNVFLCLQAACVEGLVWLGFEVAAFGCVSVSSIANARDGVLSDCCILCFTNEQSPDAVHQGFGMGSLAVTYFHMGNPHYHRRKVVSRSCSGWEGVGPTRYGRQTKG